jgi:hopanoid biosynthesis associated protein HpnK
MRVIFNADDFGRSTDINGAVVAAHRDGVLTSASLMVAEAGFAEAVRLAHLHPRLAVGLHVVVVDGQSLLGRDGWGKLVDDAGRFPPRPVALGARYAVQRKHRCTLEREIQAQFERFAETGLPLAHVDGHWNMHLHPWVSPLVVQLAKQYGAAGIRLVREPRPAPAAAAERGLARVTAAAFAMLSRRAAPLAAQAGLSSTECTLGLRHSGNMQRPAVQAALAVLQRKRVQSVEVYLHPAHQRVDKYGPNPVDLSTLLDPAMRAFINDNGMTLATYLQLNHGDADATRPACGPVDAAAGRLDLLDCSNGVPEAPAAPAATA